MIANIGRTFGQYIGLQTSLFTGFRPDRQLCLTDLRCRLSLLFLSAASHSALRRYYRNYYSLGFRSAGFAGRKSRRLCADFTGLCMLTVILSISIFGWTSFDYTRYITSFNVTQTSNTDAILPPPRFRCGAIWELNPRRFHPPGD